MTLQDDIKAKKIEVAQTRKAAMQAAFELQCLIIDEQISKLEGNE